jgi:hypothetical protein
MFIVASSAEGGSDDRGVEEAILRSDVETIEFESLEDPSKLEIGDVIVPV